MGQAKNKQWQIEKLVAALADTMSVHEVLGFANAVADLLSAEATQAENRHQIPPSQAAQWLRKCSHIVILGRWDSPVHRRILDILIGFYRSELGFLVTDAAYAPSLPHPVVSMGHHQPPPRPVTAERTYPTMFVAFLTDTAEHRAWVDTVLLITSVKAGMKEMPAKIKDLNTRGPITFLSDDPQFVDGGTIAVDTLLALDRGQAEDRSMN